MNSFISTIYFDLFKFYSKMNFIAINDKSFKEFDNKTVRHFWSARELSIAFPGFRTIAVSDLKKTVLI